MFRDGNLRKIFNLTYRYTNTPETPIADDFFIPCLRQSSEFCALFGFFTSNTLLSLLPGIKELLINNGKITFITCCLIKDEDKDAITEGYQKRVNWAFDESLEYLLSVIDEINQKDETASKLLKELIASKRLDILCVGPFRSSGISHEKCGYFLDDYGNIVTFNGSGNFTLSALTGKEGFWNHEYFQVMRSWEFGEEKYVEDVTQKLSNILSGNDKWLVRRNFSDAVLSKLVSFQRKSNLVEEVQNYVEITSIKKIPEIQLRQYQKDAIQKWTELGFNGFYEMATGTGKTITAIESIKTLWEQEPNCLVVAAVPLLALADQWEEELRKYIDTNVIICSSQGFEWENQVQRLINQMRLSSLSKPSILLVTYRSINKLFDILGMNKTIKKLLVADEAHHFKNYERANEIFTYKLGLSATPGTGLPFDKSGDELVRFFGGYAIRLPLEEALKIGVLVPYDYIPIFCYSTAEEEEEFKAYTQKIATILESEDKDYSLLGAAIRKRSLIPATCSEKMNAINEILKKVFCHLQHHLIIYCGAGDIHGKETEELRYINFVNNHIDECNHSLHTSPFTSRENRKERELILNGFENGEIDIITAIRCLDEGIDLPSIEGALILASGSSIREFIQRRGRILRKAKSGHKDHATIFDVICLPTNGTQSLAKYEFRRFYEFGKLARNWEGENGLHKILSNLLQQYGLGGIEETFMAENLNETCMEEATERMEVCDD